MGQNSSSQIEEFVASFGHILNNSNVNSVILEEIHSMTYDDFLKRLGEINKLSSKCIDSKNGTQLLFAVRKGSDSTIFWKQTIVIACVKHNSNTRKVSSVRLLTLKEFIQVFKTLKCQHSAVEQSKHSGEASKTFFNNLVGQSGSDSNNTSDNQTECCICLERKPDVLLPCAHSYCNECIEEWNADHNTCPICREKLESTDDTWVLSDVPKAEEISEEIRTTLMDLAEDKSPPCTPF